MFEQDLRECLTFDDVLLVPAASDVLPSEVDVASRLTRGIRLNTPLVSAAMDSVTEARLAITMAREGGLGIIHKNLSIADQAREVEAVKRAESGVILNPVTVEPEQSLRDVLSVMRRNNISGVPVVSGNRPLGILTSRDIRFENNLDQPVSALMTKNLVTCSVDTKSEEARALLHKHRIEKLLVVEKGELVGLITIKDLLQAERNPLASKDDRGRLLVGAAVGPVRDRDERAEALVAAGGVPQITAIADCAKEADKHNIPVIGDGGIKYSGEVAKAIAAGASTVMMGSMFAGTDEAPGEIVLFQGRSYKVYRGMGSIGAMKQGSRDRYGQAGTADEKLVPEGIEGRVPHRGKLAKIIAQVVGGLRSAMGYTGSRDVEALRKNTKFIRMTGQGLRESHVHDVIITEES